jgi:hypothetical protein
MGRLMSPTLRMASPVSVERVRDSGRSPAQAGRFLDSASGECFPARCRGPGSREIPGVFTGVRLILGGMGVRPGGDGRYEEEGGSGVVRGVRRSVSQLRRLAFVRVEGCQSCYACGYSEC